MGLVRSLGVITADIGIRPLLLFGLVNIIQKHKLSYCSLIDSRLLVVGMGCRF